jgi:hypothetical protein
MADKRPVGRPLTDLGKAITAKETALAKLRIMQTQELERKLVRADEVEWHWSAAFAALRDRALAVGERIAARGAHRSAGDLKVIVDQEIESLLSAVARGAIVAGNRNADQ